MKPTDPSQYNALAHNALRTGNPAAAREYFRAALLLGPSQADAVHYFGILLVQDGDADDGILWITRSLVLGKADKVRITNRAIALQRISNYCQAKSDLYDALAIDPLYEVALMNLGHVYKERKDFCKSIENYEKSIVVAPECYPSYDHLTYCYAFPDELSKRVISAQRAHRLSPDDPDCSFNYALYCLMVGRFTEGWELFHSRWDAKANQDEARYTPKLGFPQPRLDFTNPLGPILIWAEQGLGDEIMFLSLLREFSRHVKAQLIVQADRRMLPILRRSFPNITFIDRKVIPSNTSFNTQMPAGDLPGLVRRTRESFQNGGHPFLVVNARRYHELATRIGGANKLVVGIGWYSSNGHTRCIPLLTLAKILCRFDIALVNLQYGDKQSEISDVEKVIGKKLFVDSGVDINNDLEGLAALMKNCDLVISVANVTVHLAGALGVKTWALLPFFPGWRWFSETDNCLWYRSVSLFRQRSLGDWASVCDELESAVNQEFFHDET